jgi:hypothetical protein
MELVAIVATALVAWCCAALVAGIVIGRALAGRPAEMVVPEPRRPVAPMARVDH